jgi:hypothetical protein
MKWLYYELDDGDGLLLEEIGGRYGISAAQART